MKILHRFAAALLLLSALSGCASLGLPQPTTFNERLAVGLGSVTAIRTTATTLLQAKKISPGDAQNVQDAADNARAGLDIARVLSRSDPKAAETKLDAVTAAIRALQAYLASKDAP